VKLSLCEPVRYSPGNLPCEQSPAAHANHRENAPVGEGRRYTITASSKVTPASPTSFVAYVNTKLSMCAQSPEPLITPASRSRICPFTQSGHDSRHQFILPPSPSPAPHFSTQHSAQRPDTPDRSPAARSRSDPLHFLFSTPNVSPEIIHHPGDISKSPHPSDHTPHMHPSATGTSTPASPDKDQADLAFSYNLSRSVATASAFLLSSARKLSSIRIFPRASICSSTPQQHYKRHMLDADGH